MTSPQSVTFGKTLRKDFLFAEGYVNFNHGSFGTYPLPVRDALRDFQTKAEARPDHFIRYEYRKRLASSISAISNFVNAPHDTIVFVPNATTGINTIMRNLVFQPREKIVYFQQIFDSCGKTIQYICETTPAESVQVSYTYPVSDDFLVDLFQTTVRREQEAGNTVKIAIFDTVVSQPGVRMPFERLTAACKELGVLSCVDAAQGVGQIALDVGKLDPDFLVSNCHKWLFVPRGCAILYVPVRNQHLMRSTLPTSTGFVPKSSSSSSPTQPFAAAYTFKGTIDITPELCLPTALSYRAKLGGEDAILSYCHKLARSAGKHVAKTLGTRVLENEEGTLGNCCFANVALPLNKTALLDFMRTRSRKEADTTSTMTEAKLGTTILDWLTRQLVERHDTFMAIIFYADGWWVRLSAQVYLEMDDFEWGAKLLKELCEEVREGKWLD